MKILVFDDTEKHRRAAAVQLKGHDLTIVGTYDEAQEALLPHRDEDKADQIFEDKYGDTHPYKFDGISNELRQERVVYHGEAIKMSTTYPDFDVVLTDLLVPASKQAQSRESELAGQEMPLGAIIALLAITAGVKKVAVVTDANHHDHPASAAFDCFSPYKDGKGMSIVCENNNNATIRVSEKTMEPLSFEFLDTLEGKEKYPVRPDYSREGTTYVKNWAEVLEILEE